MIRGKLVIGLLMIAGVSLSSCNRRSESDAPAMANFGSDTGRPEDRFGKGFGEKFRADPNSQPKPVEKSDMPPVSMTTDPLPIE